MVDITGGYGVQPQLFEFMASLHGGMDCLSGGGTWKSGVTEDGTAPFENINFCGSPVSKMVLIGYVWYHMEIYTGKCYPRLLKKQYIIWGRQLVAILIYDQRWRKGANNVRTL